MKNLNLDVAHFIEKIHLIKRILIQKQFNDLPVYHGQIPLLNYVKKHDGCFQVEIADYLLVTPASIALSTKRLEKAGFLTKKIDSDNLRCKKIYITDKGREITDKCKEIFDTVDSQMLQEFTEDELSQLNLFLERMIKNLSDKNFNNDMSILSIGELIKIMKSTHREEKDND